LNLFAAWQQEICHRLAFSLFLTLLELPSRVLMISHTPGFWKEHQVWIESFQFILASTLFLQFLQVFQFLSISW